MGKIWARTEISGDLSRLSKSVSGQLEHFYQELGSWRERACIISSLLTGHRLAGTFSLAWSSRRSSIGGLLLPSLPIREVTAKKGSSRNKRGGGREVKDLDSAEAPVCCG